MKRFWIFLLSVGLIMAFSTAVFAADAKFSGEFFLQGWYNNNASLLEKDSVGTSTPAGRGSTAFYTERLRMGVDFEVAKGLKLATRFDALERKWMAARLSTATNNGITTTDQEMENIGFEIAYVQFATPIGIFYAGNTPASQFGTPFNDYVGYDNPVINWVLPKGPWTFVLSFKKAQDGVAYPGTAIGGGTDFDNDAYTGQIINRWSTGAAGVQFTDLRVRAYSSSFTMEVPFTYLFVQNKFGKIFIEDEMLMVLWGDYRDFVSSTSTDVKNGLAFSNYFNINVDLAPAKVGFMFVYSPGDDPATLDKMEGGYHAVLKNDKTFNPCLVLFNNDYVKYMGTINGAAAVGIDTAFDNVWFYQVYGGFNVTPKLNIGGSFTYAYADQKPSASYVSDKYGYELDVTMKYKIYDNLEYMLGGAYLWTGDYFKGTSSSVKLVDNYLVTHKLTLTF